MNKQIDKKTYRLFGIPVFSVTRTLDVDEFYSKVSERFSKEMTEKVLKARQR